LAVTGGGSVGECGRLSQPSWFWMHHNNYSYIYLVTYLISWSVPLFITLARYVNSSTSSAESFATVITCLHCYVS